MDATFGEDWHADNLRTLGRMGSLPQVLEQAAALAMELPGAEFAAISVITDHARIETTTVTDQTAARADQLEVELGEGPLLHAISRQVVVYLTTWPTRTGGRGGPCEWFPTSACDRCSATSSSPTATCWVH